MTHTDLQALIRARYGSQTAMAEHLGIALGTLNDIIHARTVGTLQRLAVAQALGMSPSDIWPAETSPNHAA